jgi:hypothetical protein
MTEIDPDDFINIAIEAGERDGIEALDADQRLVFLISEAEVLCDKDGIDSFLDRYRPHWMGETAVAFAQVGAAEIASGLGAITVQTARDDPLLDRINDLISSRAGYDHDAIRKVIAQRLTRRSSHEGLD